MAYKASDFTSDPANRAGHWLHIWTGDVISLPPGTFSEEEIALMSEQFLATLPVPEPVLDPHLDTLAERCVTLEDENQALLAENAKIKEENQALRADIDKVKTVPPTSKAK